MLKFYQNVKYTAMMERENDMSRLIKKFKRMYRNNEDASQVVAKIFCENFGLIKQYADLFSDIENSIKGSIALETLYNCLIQFDVSRSCQFMTYFINAYQTELRREIRNRKYQKRQVNYDHDSIDRNVSHEDKDEVAMKECISNDKNITNVCYDEYEEVELKDEIENSNLNDTEKEVCMNIVDYRTRVNKKGFKSDIAEMTGISSSWLSCILRNLRKSEFFSAKG